MEILDIVEAGDDTNAVISKINDAIKRSFAATKMKRAKRDKLTTLQNLLATNVDDMTIEQKIKHMDDIKRLGVATFSRLWDRINQLSAEVTEKDSEISNLTSNLRMKDSELRKVQHEIKIAEQQKEDFEKYKESSSRRMNEHLFFFAFHVTSSSNHESILIKYAKC